MPWTEALNHANSQHSHGGLIHLADSALQQLGLTRCQSCLQVRHQGQYHSPKCTTFEVEPDAPATTAALHACLRRASPPPSTPVCNWQDFSKRTLILCETFPKSPASCKGFQEIFLSASHQAITSTSDEAWLSFALMPWRFLQRSSMRNQLPAAKQINQRIRLFLSGHEQEVDTAAFGNERSWTDKFLQGRAQESPTAVRLRKATTLVGQGELSKASTILLSDSALLDPKDPEVQKKLNDLFISEPYPTAAIPATEAEATSLGSTTLSTAIKGADVRGALGTLHNAAAGPLGWHRSALQALARNPACLDRMADLLNKMLAGDLPDGLAKILASGQLTALSKPNGGVRPIVTRSTWIRLLSKVILLKEQGTLGSDLAPLQAGVGMPGGSEFVIHSCRELLRQHPDWAVLSVDLHNAYGTVSRQMIRNQLAKLNPEGLTFKYFERFCAGRFEITAQGMPSIAAAEGVIQGDPLSPLLFALALQPALLTTQSALRSQHSDAAIFAYLDDVVIVGPPALLESAFNVYKQAVMKIGMKVNQTKSKLLIQVPSLAAATAAANLEVAVVDSAIMVLGSPIGSPEGMLHILRDTVNIQVFKRLSELPSKQCQLLLLRSSISKMVSHLMRTVPTAILLPTLRQMQTHVMDAVGHISLQGDLGFNLHQQSEITLPLSLGGLGLANLEEEAPSAYLASALAAIQRWRGSIADGNQFLQSWVTSDSESSLQSAFDCVKKMQAEAAKVNIKTVKLPELTSDLLRFTNTKKLQHQLNDVLYHHKKYYLMNTVIPDVGEKAKFRCKSGPAASAFLQAIPSDRGLAMANQEFSIALRMYLRLPILKSLGGDDELLCHCNNPRMSRTTQRLAPPTFCTEDHIFNCRGQNARTSRHDILKNNIHEMFQSTSLQPQFEQLAGVSQGETLLFDITVKDVDAFGTHLKLDATVRNPCAKKIKGQAAIRTLYAANRGTKDKETKYAPVLVRNDRFLPLAFETYGAMHPNIREAISIAAKRVNDVPLDSATYSAPTFTTYWVQRLSVCLWRENASLASYVVGRSVAMRGHWAHTAELPLQQHVTATEDPSASDPEAD